MRDRNLRGKLNLSYLEVAEKTYSAGPLDVPVLWCPHSKALEINYIALYDDLSEYEKTDRTAIAFFQYDSVWNGQNGLFAAIYYNNKERLVYYKRDLADRMGNHLCLSNQTFLILEAFMPLKIYIDISKQG